MTFIFLKLQYIMGHFMILTQSGLIMGAYCAK